MSEVIEQLAARLGALEDREAIRALVAAYGPLADAGDAQAVADLWCEDGVYEVSGFARAQGRAEIAALIDGPTHRALMATGCAHLLGPVSITLQGNRATARGHSIVFRHEDGRFAAHRVSANCWTLIRTGLGEHGGWQVLHRANALLDGTEAAQALLSFTPPQPAS